MENVEEEITEEEQRKNFEDLVKNGPRFHGETPECLSVIRIIMVLTGEASSFTAEEQTHMESCPHCQKGMESSKRVLAKSSSEKLRKGFEEYLKQHPH